VRRFCVVKYDDDGKRVDSITQRELGISKIQNGVGVAFHIARLGFRTLAGDMTSRHLLAGRRDELPWHDVLRAIMHLLAK
jgi:hypothetical protein